MKRYLMKCGHYANIFDNKGHMACGKCVGHTPDAEILIRIEE